MFSWPLRTVTVEAVQQFLFLVCLVSFVEEDFFPHKPFFLKFQLNGVATTMTTSRRRWRRSVTTFEARPDFFLVKSWFGLRMEAKKISGISFQSVSQPRQDEKLLVPLFPHVAFSQFEGVATLSSSLSLWMAPFAPDFIYDHGFSSVNASCTRSSVAVAPFGTKKEMLKAWQNYNECGRICLCKKQSLDWRKWSDQQGQSGSSSWRLDFEVKACGFKSRPAALLLPLNLLLKSSERC